MMSPFSTCTRLLRTSLLGALAASLLGCGPADDDIQFNDDETSLTCDMSGTWGTLVEVAVEWSSITISPGTGSVRQWILSERTMSATGGIDVARSCGIGTRGTPLGSPWFATNEIAGDPPALSEWTGVSFSDDLFDNETLPLSTLDITLNQGDPRALAIGNPITTSIVPFSHGVDGLDPAEWPELEEMKAYARDHDGDGYPALTGLPFQGEVPGTNGTQHFQNPRLTLATSPPPPRASALFLAIRNRAALHLQLSSCSPPTFVGGASDLFIETRNMGCTVADTGQPCIPDQYKFIDFALPQFNANGISRVISKKLPPGSTCPDVRRLVNIKD
jgi:hypothetical protein